ncbi:MAG TPA: efflux RND transporter periplasmic adaptor subunit [Thermoanaerobaculia bacterium]|nr:efflux RND transporter periplasmic adaptor subunit [Thermoanaerobaculia bacterium]
MSVLTPQETKKKKSRKRLWITIIAAVVIIAITVASVANKRKDKPIPVTIEKAQRKTITQLVTATGKIQPEIEVKIAPEVSGEIVELPVHEGQTIHKGDLLLRIKPDVYKAQVESQQAALAGSKAAIEQHRAELSKADLDLKRIKNLHAQHLVSDQDLNAAQTQYDIAKSALNTSQFDVQRAEGSLRQITDSFSKTTIYSPADGTISALESRLGERVVGTSQFAGTEVMRIADLSDMEAQVNVNENDVINVKVGDHAKISVDAYPDRKVDGVVREIATTASTQNAGSQEEVTNFLVKITVTDKSVALHPGMSATADIESATVQNAVAVPIQSVTVRQSDSNLSPEELEKRKATQAAADKSDNRADVTNETEQKQKERAQRDNLTRVVFIKKGDKVEERKVETGIADTTDIEIKSGVRPGEEVVSGSYTVISRRLKDGAKVEIEKQQGQSKSS